MLRILKSLVGLMLLAIGISGSAFAQKVVLTVTPPAATTGVTISAYNFYRSDTSGGQVIGVNHFPGQINPTYTDATVVVGKTYYYKATVWCQPCGTAGQESAFSNEAKIFIPVPVIIVPAPVLAQPQVTFP